jgi:hypothetical protein
MHFIRVRRFPFFRLLIAIAVGWVWVRSHYHSDVLGIFLHRGTAQGLMSDRGRAVMFFTNISLGDARAYTYDHLAMPNEEFTDLRALLYETPPLPVKVSGIQLGASGPDAFGLPGAKYHFIIVPMWMLAALAGVPLFMGLRTFWVRRRWGMPGVCGGCGYDLRASSGRCPECGWAIPVVEGTAPKMPV